MTAPTIAALRARLAGRRVLSLVEAIAASHGTTLAAILGGCRDRATSAARAHACVGLLHRTGGSPAEIGWLLGIDRSAVRYAIRKWPADAPIVVGLVTFPGAEAGLVVTSPREARGRS